MQNKKTSLCWPTCFLVIDLLLVYLIFVIVVFSLLPAKIELFLCSRLHSKECFCTDKRGFCIYLFVKACQQMKCSLDLFFLVLSWVNTKKKYWLAIKAVLLKRSAPNILFVAVFAILFFFFKCGSLQRATVQKFSSSNHQSRRHRSGAAQPLFSARWMRGKTHTVRGLNYVRSTEWKLHASA